MLPDSFLIVVVCLLRLTLSAQPINYNWILSDHHFSFSDSGIELVGRYELDINAMCGNNISVINDDNGDISVYTDGLNLFDRNYEITPNGSELKTRALSNSSMLLIPNLFAAGEHYIFYLPDEFSPVQGIWYSIIDMSLNEGKGDIREDHKNLSLISDVTFSYIDIIRGLCENVIIIAKESESQNVYFVEIDPIMINDPVIRSIEGLALSDFAFKGGIAVSETSKSIIIHNGSEEAIHFKYDNDLNISDIIKLPFDESTRVSSAGAFTHAGEYYFGLEETNYFTEPDIPDTIKIYRYGPFTEMVNFHKTYIDMVRNNQNSITLGSDRNLYLLNINDVSGPEFQTYLGQITNPENDNVQFQRDFYTFPKVDGRNLCLFNSNNKNIVARRSIDRSYISSDDQVLCIDDPLELEIKFNEASNISYTWSTGDTTSRMSIEDYGSYYVTAEKGGCIVMDTIVITEDPRCNIDCKLYLPNAISLSSMRGNDSFMPVSTCDLLDYRLEIYDRWGGLLFKSTDPLLSWDGSTATQQVQSGVYPYQIQYRYPSDQVITNYTGAITVVR